MNDPAPEEAQIFVDALLMPVAERTRYLEIACQGNATLQQRIAALIQAHEAADQFMTPPAAGRAEADTRNVRSALDDRSGSRIGRYKLLQRLGEGGCGVVWMAEQEEPVRRRVALKVIKLGMDTKNVIARFDAERQALALMDHPNISRVLDAGATETGRPFFVMELVPGIPITKYCDQHNLPTPARLALFTQVCHAIQHAHHKGIIHRDLKPSNILVTLHDGEPVPKVIDFGIAKATQGRLTDQTLFTAFEQFIGTPAYMSPEQAEMSGIDIDTRSDIYSLGVLLYELLTGRPPFDPKTLLQAGLDEIRRIIREDEPMKPSRRLTTLANSDLDSTARQRGIAPAQLSPLIRGDLDWIVMKALEKKRDRRYETANGLAMDIKRHLQNEPVSARPPTTGYRISRFIRRNRFAFIAGSLVSIALVAGTIVSTTQALRARRAERVAAAERTRAEDLLGFMLGDLRTQLAKVGRLDVLEGVSKKAMNYFSSREPSELDDATLARYSKALTQLGEIHMDQEHFPQAAAAFAEAYNRASALVTRHPRDGDMLFERGQAEYWNGFVYWERGEFGLATDWLNRYHHTCAALVKLDPKRPEWQSELAYGNHNLAVLRLQRGEFDAAWGDFLAELATLKNLLAATPTDLELQFRISSVYSWQGELAEQRGELGEAMKQFGLQTAQLEQLVQTAPRAALWRFKLADSLLSQVDIAMVTGRFILASEKLQVAGRMLDELTSLDPHNPHWEMATLNTRWKQAMLARQQGDLTAAGQLLEKILPRLEQLSDAEPSDRGFTLWLAKAFRLKAQILLSSDQAGAEIAVVRAIQLTEKLVHEARATSRDVGECALASIVAGEIALRSHDATAARRHWENAAEILASRLQNSRDWRLLDPAVRAAARLGHTETARTMVAQLNQLGYVPLDPWPEIKSLGAVPFLQP
jgi:serine/threonine protein kinase